MLDLHHLASDQLAAAEPGLLNHFLGSAGGDYLRERRVLNPRGLDLRRLRRLLHHPDDDFPLHLADALFHVLVLADGSESVNQAIALWLTRPELARRWVRRRVEVESTPRLSAVA